MKKGMLYTLASLLLGASLTTLAGGAIPIPPPFFLDNIRLVLSGAVSIEPQTAIIEGIVDNNEVLNAGLNDKSIFVNYALGFETWFPLLTWSDQQINAVALTNFIPGNSETASVVESTGQLSHTRLVADDSVYLKSWRLNWGMGVNFLRAFDENFFVEAMLGAGLSWYHAKAEFIAESDNGNDSGADHPGASTVNPFVMAELGIGIQVAEKSALMLFMDGAWVDQDNNFVLAPNNDDDAFVNVETANWWLLVGLKFSRSVDL